MTKQSILIVDDEVLLRLSLKINLEREGYDIDVAESAESALLVLKERPYDLLLTDYLMEGIDGTELMQRARERYPEIKVIIFSGFEDEDSSEKFQKLGADDFFCKPISFEDMLERIAKVLPSRNDSR